MHYLLVHSANEWSGTARAFTAAACGLAARGHAVTVAVEPDSTIEQIVSQEATKGGKTPLFHVASLSLRGPWLGTAWRLRTLARSRRAEALFVHTDREHFIAAVALRLGSRAKIVRRVPAGQTAVLRRSGRVATWLAPTCLMFTSEVDMRVTSAPRRAVARVVVPLGVSELDGGDASMEHAAGAAYADHTVHRDESIVCVHDASSRGRAAAAIRTIAMLVPRHPDLQLVITGDAVYDDDLRMQAAALGMLHHVSFLGDRADELEVMRGACLGWVVADSDTAAYGILDFMALGVPVLGSEETVAEQYILPHMTGLLLPPDDMYLAAASVANLLSSDQQRVTMGQAARAHVVRECSVQAMIDGFEHAASTVVARKRR